LLQHYKSKLEKTVEYERTKISSSISLILSLSLYHRWFAEFECRMFWSKMDLFDFNESIYKWSSK